MFLMGIIGLSHADAHAMRKRVGSLHRLLKPRKESTMIRFGFILTIERLSPFFRIFLIAEKKMLIVTMKGEATNGIQTG
jgi:hypothetical protein